jgi:hypothetical protein
MAAKAPMPPKDAFEESEYDVEEPGVKEGSPRDIRRDQAQRKVMARDLKRGRR